ncbi:hypothetical protein BJ165DRAFT_1535002 [Panaeolus papilionaceus]|nr:hypothetical protein BJ165DRAFT_1535002 [Panaeolus papilionaceus]
MPASNLFVDLEAFVDEDDIEESDHENERLEDFIDDYTLDIEETRSSAYRKPDIDEHQDDEEEDVDGRGSADSDTLARWDATQDAVAHWEEAHGHVLPRIQELLGVGPLWRVGFKAGTENEAATTAQRQFRKFHIAIHSVIAPPFSRGWIYFQAEWSDNISHILLSIPGALKTRNGLRRYAMTTHKWEQIMSAPSPLAVNKGDWVQLTAGPYKGDPAIVNWANPEDGSLTVLVIPRIDLNKTTLKNAKRKRASAPPPLLFDPDLFERKTGREARRDENGHHVVGIFQFESGLLRHDVPHHTIQVDPVSLPLSMFLMFRRSGHHLAFSHMHPKPNEWCINKDDRVRVTSEPATRGTVAAVSTRHLEVLGDEGVGLVCVLWGDVLKDFVENDFVEVVAGPCAGRSGWVLTIVEVEATVLDESTVLQDTSEEMQVHLNCLKSTVPNMERTRGLHVEHLGRTSNRHPWLNTGVIIAKPGSPWRTKSGCIRDVIRTQMTSRLFVRLETFDPAHPFRDVWVESNDVVEKTTGLMLQEYFSRTPQPIPVPNSMTADAKDSTNGNVTPTWESDNTATPLWPSLPSPSPSLHAAAPPTPSHPLLDRRLLNAPLRATLNGRTFNGAQVSILLKEISGSLVLYYVSRNKHTPIDPSWVTLRHPNPQRDNGLLVVVTGEHCGTFVRRIRHVNRRGVGMIILVAAMQRVAGQCDRIAGELEFKESKLCVSEESSEDKELNTTLMTDIRKRAQKEF